MNYIITHTINFKSTILFKLNSSTNTKYCITNPNNIYVFCRNEKTLEEDCINALHWLPINAGLELEMREPAAAGQLIEVLSSLNYVTEISKRRKGLLVRVREPESDFPSLIRTASANSELLGVRPIKLSFEGIFLKFTEDMRYV